jgi:hypothetical protein
MYVLQKSCEAWDVGRMQQGTAACWLGWRNNCLPSRRALVGHDTPLASSRRLYPAFGVLVGQASVGKLPNSDAPQHHQHRIFLTLTLLQECAPASALVANCQGFQSSFQERGLLWTIKSACSSFPQYSRRATRSFHTTECHPMLDIPLNVTMVTLVAGKATCQGICTGCVVSHSPSG